VARLRRRRAGEGAAGHRQARTGLRRLTGSYTTARYEQTKLFRIYEHNQIPVLLEEQALRTLVGTAGTQAGQLDRLLAAPLLAEEGIDLDNPGTLDPVVLQLALNRAVERRNLALFAPAASVAGCIGLALGLLDTWLSGQHSDVPDGLGERIRQPKADCFQH
jgi:hypothetical protein